MYYLYADDAYSQEGPETKTGTQSHIYTLYIIASPHSTWMLSAYKLQAQITPLTTSHQPFLIKAPQ